MSSTNFEGASGGDDGERLPAAEDDKSSSLSELGDRAGIEQSSLAGSEANDTEAETERLDDSPQKQRRQLDVVLTSTNGTYGDYENQSTACTLAEQRAGAGSYSTDVFQCDWLTVS